MTIDTKCFNCDGKRFDKYFYCKNCLIDLSEIDEYDDSGNRTWKRQLKDELKTLGVNG